MCLEQENIYRAVALRTGRALALLAWTAGAGLAGRAGTSWAAIKQPYGGGEFPERKEGISPKRIRTHGAQAVTLRTGRTLALLT